MAGSDRRGEVVAALGMVLCVSGAVILAILAIWSRSSSLWAIGFQVLGTAGVWLLTWIQLHQQHLVREEQFEVMELERLRQEKLAGARTIFEEEDLDQMEKLATSRRLRSIERYLVPFLALLLAAFHLAAGIVILPWFVRFGPIADAMGGSLEHPRALLFAAGAGAFICFMYSRWAMGMSRLPNWWMLRAGGDSMFGSSAVCLAVAIALLCVISGLQRVEQGLAIGLGFLLIVLAIETVINFVLDLYRPRVAGETQRPFYDSRLLGIFSEPGGILRSMANAVDYQFGFKVSETWFYKLLGRAVLPLLIVQMIVILALTCIVVVPPANQAVIEHFGQPLETTAGPGIHLKWFWPVDRSTMIPVQRIRRMELGYDVEKEEAARQKHVENRGPILWTKQHYKNEYKLLVGDKAASATIEVPVNLLSVNMPVQWRVKSDPAEVQRFHAQSQDPAAILESLAYSELTRYAARADVLALMGEKGATAAQDLHVAIQQACDHAGSDGKGLGIEIVYVGIGGIHPPPDEDVAKSYEEVVSAYEKRDAAIKAAEGDAIQMQLFSAGMKWPEFHDAIVKEDEACELGSDDLTRRTQTVETMLRSDNVLGGIARSKAADAEIQAVGHVFREMSNARRYEMQLAAFKAAPEVYSLRVYLRMLRDGLKNIRKYVVVLDEPDRVLYEFDLKPPEQFEVTGAELGAMEAKMDSTE
ncbi:MAG: SPFH domain-containing protein [Planctomycetota bacterium]